MGFPNYILSAPDVSLLVYVVPRVASGITTNVLEFQLITKKVKYHIILLM